MKVDILVKNSQKSGSSEVVVTLNVERSGAILGRKSQACRISDPAVSSKHLLLFPDDGALSIVDLSRNGTYVDSKRIQNATVEVGSTIRVGDTLLTILRIREEHLPSILLDNHHSQNAW